jgi:hypothetical protein
METNRKSYLLTHIRWDCPSALCNGWLDVYGFDNEMGKKPTVKWVQCAAKCGINLVLSQFHSGKPCQACDKIIPKVFYIIDQSCYQF